MKEYIVIVNQKEKNGKELILKLIHHFIKIIEIN